MLGDFCILAGFLTEMVFFLYKTGEAMLDATVRPFIIRAVCADMTRDMVLLSSHWTPRKVLFANGTLDPCEYLQELPALESAVQTRAATFLMLYRILVNVPAVFLGLFCGAWSDLTGRKLPMMIPSLGSILAVLLYLLGVLIPKHTLMIIMMGAAAQGLMGKSSVITMAVNSYITDTSHKEERTRKLGKLLAMNFFGLFVGSLLAGTLQDVSNLQTTLAVVAVFHAASVFTVFLCVEESIHDKMPSEEGFQTEDMKHGLFSIKGVKDSVYVLVRPREGGKRTLVLTAFLGMFLNQACKVGEQDVTVLFVQRPPLSWSASSYGYLLSVDYAGMGLCLLLLLPVLSTFLKINDINIVLIGLCCKLVRILWAGFCTKTWMVYVSVVIGSMAGIIASALRSILSKAICEDETGKVFALASSAETAAKLIGSISFTNIYGASADIWAGLAYMCEAMIYLLIIMLMVWLYKENQLMASKERLSATPIGQPIPSIVETKVAQEGPVESDSLLPLSASATSLVGMQGAITP